MDIFTFRDSLIKDYTSYVQSFIQIRNPLVQAYVQEQLKQDILWPNPLIQLSPHFESGVSIDILVAEGVLHPECTRIFRVGKTADGLQGHSLQLHKHQDEAISITASGAYDDVDYIMETFPIVKRKDEKAFGEYRTKRVILEMYDAMAHAIETGTAYETWLEPEPASIQVAHAPRETMDIHK